MKSKEVQKWILYADEDLRLAEKIFREKGFSPHVIFHCHDAIEKYLKAIIRYQGREFSYVHDLEVLTNQLKIEMKDSVDLMNAAIILNILYPIARYPGKDQITFDQAEKALKAAQKAEKIILKYLQG